MVHVFKMVKTMTDIICVEEAPVAYIHLIVSKFDKNMKIEGRRRRRSKSIVEWKNTLHMF